MKTKIWKIPKSRPMVSTELLKAGYNPLLAAVLTLRGVGTAREAEKLIRLDEGCLHDPFLIMGMDKAVARLKKAFDNKEYVAVYGDYDVDGITSTCVLTDYLRTKGLKCYPYIPDRVSEGYGVNCGAIDKLKSLGVSLIITVDCGITAVKEVRYAKSLGIDMLITDHHECKADNIPTEQAIAVLDCKQEGDNYPNPNLSGVGMVFKLICACEGEYSGPLERYADLVAIGLVADVMPLIGENRFLVRKGIELIKANPRFGLDAIMQFSKIKRDGLTATDIGFKIAPRINAAGRLGQANIAGKLLLSTDKYEAWEFADHLCNLNASRQAIEQTIWKEANDILSASTPTAPIVLASDEWNQGVIGIAASRLAEHYSLPVVMVHFDGEMGKGSCRSYGNFNLFAALSACSEHLVSFGGHALAAGLNIRRDQIDDFRQALGEYYNNNRPEEQPDVVCDMLITRASMLSSDNVASLDLLEPYGTCNPKPVFCMVGVRLVEEIEVGGGKHLKMKIQLDGAIFDCIFFSHTRADLDAVPGNLIDIAFTPNINTFNGRSNVQLQISAARLHRED